jgi:NhaP-type Na+/H+ or K+/H+ antiporter
MHAGCAVRAKKVRSRLGVMTASPAFDFAFALGAGIACQIAARHLRIPSIVPLLAAGVLLGPDLLGAVDPDRLGDGLFTIVRLAVAVILFEGGLNLELRRLQRESLPIRRLVTWGALVTGVGASVAARTLLDWPWPLAALFGALVTVTGPTVVKPLLRFVPLRPRLATVLEAEGVLIDPVGAILAVVTLEVVLEASTMDSLAHGALGLVGRLAFGSALGLGGGYLLARLLRSEGLVPEGFANLVALGGALLLHETAESLVSESGILTVTLAGVMVGNLGARIGRELRDFEEQLTVALIGLLFVLLAADVRIAEVAALGWAGLATVAALVLLVRPIDVALSTAGSELELRERAFLAWMAPRGVVAASVASLFASVLDGAGIEGGSALRALVFLTIAVTVVVQGGSARFVARLLGVRAPGRDTIAVLGAGELALALGELLRQGGRRVLFLDSNPAHIRAAEERGFAVAFGNALEISMLSRARLERALLVVGLTPNDEVNSLFAREAFEEFDVRESFVAVSRRDRALGARILEKQQSRVLFGGRTDVERWSTRIRHGIASVVELTRTAAAAEPAADGDAQTDGGSDAFLRLAWRRGDAGWLPFHAGAATAPGDRIAVALHDAERDGALATLRQLGFAPAAPAEGARPAR